MVDSEAVAALLGGVEAWNRFVSGHPNRPSYDFEGADLRVLAKITGTHEFPMRAYFTKCTFDVLDLANTSFPKGADFSHATIESHAEIQIGEAPSAEIIFNETTFMGPVTIRAGRIKMLFVDCKFMRGLQLEGDYDYSFKCVGQTEVHGWLWARSVTFNRPLSFKGLQLKPIEDQSHVGESELDFRGARFATPVDFTSMSVRGVARFESAEFHASCDFRETVFHEAPVFHGAKLYPETYFDLVDCFDRQFPDILSDGAEARYQKLKNLMGELQALGQQLGFARLELKAHTAKLPYLSLHRFYAWFGDYGLSWAQPTFWLLFLTAVCWAVYMLLVPAKDWAAARELTMVVSMSNAVPFVGILRSFDLDGFWSHYAGYSRIAVTVLLVAQSVASLILLFLIGLGIRNRLRMK